MGKTVIKRTCSSVDSICKKFTVEQTRSLVDLTAVWKIDCTFYGDSCVSFRVLDEWWMLHPYGHYTIKTEGHVIGGLGIWPLAESVYRALQIGCVPEMAIKPCSQRISSISHWYLSGIVLNTEYHKSRAAWCLLCQAINQWKQYVENLNITIGAIPISTDGLKLLKHTGFTVRREAYQRPDGYPFYGLSLHNKYILY